MGTLHSIEEHLRATAAKQTRGEIHEDIVMQGPVGECPGCGALRSFVIVCHDTGTDAGRLVTSITSPHMRCDGGRVICQDIGDEDPEEHGSGTSSGE